MWYNKKRMMGGSRGGLSKSERLSHYVGQAGQKPQSVDLDKLYINYLRAKNRFVSAGNLLATMDEGSGVQIDRICWKSDDQRRMGRSCDGTPEPVILNPYLDQRPLTMDNSTAYDISNMEPKEPISHVSAASKVSRLASQIDGDLTGYSLQKPPSRAKNRSRFASADDFLATVDEGCSTHMDRARGKSVDQLNEPQSLRPSKLWNNENGMKGSRCRSEGSPNVHQQTLY